MGIQAAIWSKTAESSQKDNASSFPSVLWESLGTKCPIPAKPSSLGTHKAQAKGQLKIVCLANGADWKPDAWKGLGVA